MKSAQPVRLLSLLLPLLFLAAPLSAVAQDAKATPAAITNLLQEFLAKNEERAQHDRFWADDLVYTSSKAEVITKADIMKGFTADQPDATKPKEPATTFSAEDIVVRPYGNMAALTFRLVAHDPDGKLSYYRNSGTFLFRHGQWQAVTWQATKVPESEAKPSK